MSGLPLISLGQRGAAIGAAEQDHRFKRLICRQSNMLVRSEARVR